MKGMEKVKCDRCGSERTRGNAFCCVEITGPGKIIERRILQPAAMASCLEMEVSGLRDEVRRLRYCVDELIQMMRVNGPLPGAQVLGLVAGDEFRAGDFVCLDENGKAVLADRAEAARRREAAFVRQYAMATYELNAQQARDAVRKSAESAAMLEGSGGRVGLREKPIVCGRCFKRIPFDGQIWSTSDGGKHCQACHELTCADCANKAAAIHGRPPLSSALIEIDRFEAARKAAIEVAAMAMAAPPSVIADDDETDTALEPRQEAATPAPPVSAGYCVSCGGEGGAHRIGCKVKA